MEKKENNTLKVIKLIWNGKHGKVFCEYLSEVRGLQSNSHRETVSAVLLQLKLCKELELEHKEYLKFDDMPQELREEAEKLINTTLEINKQALRNRIPVYIAAPGGSGS
jgi:hypothetical protein